MQLVHFGERREQPPTIVGALLLGFGRLGAQTATAAVRQQLERVDAAQRVVVRQRGDVLANRGETDLGVVDHFEECAFGTIERLRALRETAFEQFDASERIEVALRLEVLHGLLDERVARLEGPTVRRTGAIHGRGHDAPDVGALELDDALHATCGERLRRGGRTRRAQLVRQRLRVDVETCRVAALDLDLVAHVPCSFHGRAVGAASPTWRRDPSQRAGTTPSGRTKVPRPRPRGRAIRGLSPQLPWNSVFVSRAPPRTVAPMPREGRTALPTLLLDYRPALHNREGIGRVARELVRALAWRDDRPPLVLFGGALRGPRVPTEELGLVGAHAVRLAAPRVPARLAEPLFSLLGGADRVFDAGLVHHTQLRRLPARRAPSTAMVFDLLFLDGGAGRLAPSAARSMERRLRDLVRHVARVQVTSTVVRDQVAEHLALPLERIDLVTLGGDHVTRAPKVPRDDPRLPQEPYLLSVSRLDPRKGFDLALAAFERLVARGFDGRWVVVGPPGYGAADLEAALARSPAAARIERRRHTPDDELAALYRHAEAFVFASRAEGFGLPPIEAMWSDCPVVSSRATCLAEVVGDGADTFDPDDDPNGDVLFGLVERAVSDAKYRDALRARGARWRTRHTWKACADGSLASWRAAVDRGSSR